MKIDARRVEAFLRDPGGCAVVLLYGDDTGLIRARARALVRAVAGATDDPFRVVELERGEAARLPEEASSLSLTGGRRVVWMREAGDTATDAVTEVLREARPALVVVEAPGLTARSRLRQAVEKATSGAAIACYPEDGAALERTVREALAALSVRIDPEALDWTVGQLGADHGSTRAEIEKLALYAGEGGVVDLETALACLGDLSGLSLEDALYAATAGRAELADRALALALAEGGAAVGVLRGAALHLQRLHRVRLRMDTEGATAADAVGALRPPVFFRRAGQLAQAASRWSAGAITRALRDVTNAELACKRTGAPADVICRQTILSLAARAGGAAPARLSPG